MWSVSWTVFFSKVCEEQEDDEAEANTCSAEVLYSPCSIPVMITPPLSTPTQHWLDVILGNISKRICTCQTHVHCRPDTVCVRTYVSSLCLMYVIKSLTLCNWGKHLVPVRCQCTWMKHFTAKKPTVSHGVILLFLWEVLNYGLSLWLWTSSTYMP